MFDGLTKEDIDHVLHDVELISNNVAIVYNPDNWERLIEPIDYLYNELGTQAVVFVEDNIVRAVAFHSNAFNEANYRLLAEDICVLLTRLKPV